MNTFSNDMPWVIFHLMKEQFAISTKNVQEMVAMPKVIPVPKTPKHVRGVINLRGSVLPVMDLRLKLGMDSMVKETKELIQLLKTREQDHKNWINELELSVKERRNFTLATDPHKCGFGMWYDNFKTDSRVLESCLKKFDTPHKIIHSIAIKVRAFVEQSDFDSAFALIENTKKHELAEMILLFEEAIFLLEDSTREIAMVLKGENKTIVISVDSVTAVEKLSLSNIDDMPDIISSKENEYICGVGKRENNEDFIQLLDVEKLIDYKNSEILQNS